MKKLLSPLRYPGGKSRAVGVLKNYIPPNTKTLVSPFLGGGSFELSCAADGLKVYGADAFMPLINFWQHAKDTPDSLAEKVKSYYPIEKEQFYVLQKKIMGMPNDLGQAAIFFVLNRCSFSGTTLSGGMSPGHPRFTESAIDRLRNFTAPNLYVEYADFQNTINKYPEDLLYLDPPYLVSSNLYGKKGNMHNQFDHAGLADLLRNRSGWILSYNDHPDIRKMYEGFDICIPEWVYGMSKNKNSNELLILNM